MNRTRLQRIATGLLPFIVAACAVAGWAQTASAREDDRARLVKAEAMFAERCKKSGEFIHRTAENVEGVFLMKIRPKEINYGDQFKMDDPYGNDSGGETYIKTFFSGFYKRSSPPPSGYRYVDATDPKDGERYRYTGRIDQPWLRDKRYGEWVREFVLDKVSAPGEAPRYGVTYDDISTRDEREYWIAGSSLKVIDLKTNEVMAERIGYMMDRGQGNTNGGRSPWLLAARNACPAFRSASGIPPIQTDQTRMFVVKVLHPNKEQ
ncbi:MAG: hypothetical protein HZA62_00380 [Rhodocyclales bacterium]|nr:hypothetical protein [Rhodocyclales bacterium]